MPQDTRVSLVAYCRANERICPQPLRWQELWEKLPNRRRVGLGWEPALPLILAAWHDAPAMVKMLRLADHIEWADSQNALADVSEFLRKLPEEDWFHIGE